MSVLFSGLRVFRRASEPGFVLLALGFVACGQDPGGGVVDVADGNNGGDIATIPIPIADTGSVGGADVADGESSDGEPLDGSGSGGEGLGDLCTTSADCPAELDCVYSDPGAPSGVCTTGCDEDADCPSGWRCYTLTDSGGDADRECLPEDLCIDGDGDGFGWGGGCLGRDCDDSAMTINPAADELCNGLDDDCDTRVDDNAIEDRTDCETGFAGTCATGRNSCTNGVLECRPAATLTEEVCDGEDNDCDGNADEGDVCGGDACCYEDTCEGVCRLGTNGADETCAPPETWGEEVCDRLDNDCDGSVDEDVATVGTPCTAAAVGTCAVGTLVCGVSGMECVAAPSADELCDTLDNDCDGAVDEGDVCADACCFGDICAGVCATASIDDSGSCVEPSGYGAETCDLRDNDCDGSVDEGVASTWYRDVDGDGYGSSAGGTVSGCSPPVGYVANDQDCNDTDGGVRPGAAELAGDGTDQDCDGQEVCFVDSDGDGFRVAATVLSADNDCSDGGEAAAGAPAGDCDDGNVLVNPGRPEVCNGADDNCDGATDEGGVCSGTPCCFSGTCEGVCGGARLAADGSCGTPVGWGEEVCDGVDNDCDSAVDESDPSAGTGCDTGAAGVCSSGTRVCAGSRIVCSANSGPGAESCNGQDDDCDGSIDEGIGPVWFRDVDGDGYGFAGNGTVQSCSQPGGFVANNDDCQDGNGSVFPGRGEDCNGADDNCNGAVDEGVSCVTGQCGPANGGSTPSAPGAGLCNSGTPTAVSGDGPYTWSCVGSAGLPSESCNSNRSCTSAAPSWAGCSSGVGDGAHGATASLNDNEQPTVGSASVVCSQGSWQVQGDASCLNLDDTCPYQFGGGVTSSFSQGPQQGSNGHWYCVVEQFNTEYGTCEDDSRSVSNITGPPLSCNGSRRTGQCCDAYPCFTDCNGDLCQPTSGSCRDFECRFVDYYNHCQVP